MYAKPILLLLFNRPSKTKRLLEALSVVQPSKIYVGCDGPRNETDHELIAEVKAKIEQLIHWPCQIKTLYRTENLGSGMACSQAITWFFEQESEGIILEDDCLPGVDFFPFCEELLNKYRDDDRVMHIGGFNLFQKPEIKSSYYISIYPKVWGWATWRSSWNKMKLDITEDAPFIRKGGLKPLFNNDSLQTAFWEIIYHKMSDPSNKSVRNVWDYMWTYAIRKNGGLCITPYVNLVQNIGFDEEGTHTDKMGSIRKRILTTKPERLTFPIHHPAIFQADKKEDYLFFKYQLVDSRLKFLKVWIKRLFPFLAPLK